MKAADLPPETKTYFILAVEAAGLLFLIGIEVYVKKYEVDKSLIVGNAGVVCRPPLLRRGKREEVIW